MPIKAVILDLDGTLIDTTDNIVAGVPQMISSLQQNGVAVYVASNRLPAPPVDFNGLGITPNEYLTRRRVGQRKGTGAFVDAVLANLRIERNELLYLGDSVNDMREAVNSKVAFFLAAWSNPTYSYGLAIKTPARFAHIVKTFFLKDKLWFYRINSVDHLTRTVAVRALLDPDTAISTGIRDLLKRNILGPPIKTYSLPAYLSFHLFSSVYLEGLHLHGSQGGPTIWCIYPGHDGSQGRVLSTFAQVVSRLFHDNYQPSLINRHTPSIKSAYARWRGETVDFANQLKTINLSPALRRFIEDRTILVFDDFTTEAYSFEAARNFLYNAGAREVISIAVGKYRKPYYPHCPHPGVVWDSFAPANLEDRDFRIDAVEENYDLDAVTPF
ncbi:MAG: hypothetical protein V7641_841 [Blastocatellia bacterium]